MKGLLDMSTNLSPMAQMMLEEVAKMEHVDHWKELWFHPDLIADMRKLPQEEMDQVAIAFQRKFHEIIGHCPF